MKAVRVTLVGIALAERRCKESRSGVAMANYELTLYHKYIKGGMDLISFPSHLSYIFSDEH